MMPLTRGACRTRHGRVGAAMVVALAVSVSLVAAVTGSAANAAATLDHTSYGTTQGGQAVDIYTMTNDHGVRVRFLSYGGVITEIDVPDRTGRFDDIVLGLSNLHEYKRSARITAQSPAAMPTALPGRSLRWMARPTISLPITAPTRCTAVRTRSIRRSGTSHPRK